MRRTAWWLMGALGLAAACSGKTDDGESGAGGSSGSGGSSASGGTGGSSASGGTGGAGGAGGATGGTAGSSGSGGTAGTSGAGGTAGTSGAGGTTADAGQCDPSASGTTAALCLSFAPEAITALSDPAFDLQGVLVVELFDTALPDQVDGGATPLGAQIYPPPTDAGQAEVALSAIPELRFDGLPATVYARAFFVDNPALWGQEDLLDGGAFIGGVDLSTGIRDPIPLDGVPLTLGAGTSRVMPLVALRRLTVTTTIAAGVTPLDDGQGPLSIAAFGTDTPGATTSPRGFVTASCVDVTGGATVTGVLVGSADAWLFGYLDDFHLTTDLPPGSLYSADLGASGPVLRPQNRITVGTSYQVTHAIELNQIAGLPDGGAPAGFSCLADAGAD